MRKIIAIYEIIAGIVTLAGSFIIFGVEAGTHGQATLPWSSPAVFILALGIALGAWLLIAGIMLLKNKSWGYILSIIIQLIQAITIQTSHFHFQFFSPFNFGASFSKLGANIFSGAGYILDFNLAQQPVTTTTIGVNLVALVVLILLIALFRKNKKADRAISA